MSKCQVPSHRPSRKENCNSRTEILLYLLSFSKSLIKGSDEMHWPYKQYDMGSNKVIFGMTQLIYRLEHKYWWTWEHGGRTTDDFWTMYRKVTPKRIQNGYKKISVGSQYPKKMMLYCENGVPKFNVNSNLPTIMKSASSEVWSFRNPRNGSCGGKNKRNKIVT